MTQMLNGPQATDAAAEILTELACQVCANHTLAALNADGLERGLVTRLVCQSCGAHQVGRR